MGKLSGLYAMKQVRENESTLYALCLCDRERNKNEWTKQLKSDFKNKMTARERKREGGEKVSKTSSIIWC